jgi:hypothetical protein
VPYWYVTPLTSSGITWPVFHANSTIANYQVGLGNSATVENHDCSDVSTASCVIQLLRNTNTSGPRQVVINKGDGSATQQFVFDAVTGNMTVAGSLTGNNVIGATVTDTGLMSKAILGTNSSGNLIDNTSAALGAWTTTTPTPVCAGTGSMTGATSSLTYRKDVSNLVSFTFKVYSGTSGTCDASGIKMPLPSSVVASQLWTATCSNNSTGPMGYANLTGNTAYAIIYNSAGTGNLATSTGQTIWCTGQYHSQ